MNGSHVVVMPDRLLFYVHEVAWAALSFHFRIGYMENSRL
jgi:hypothetical protein